MYYLYYNHFGGMCSVQTLLYYSPVQEDIPRRVFQECAKNRLNLYQEIDTYKEEQIDKLVEKIKAKNPTREKEEIDMVTQITNPWAVSNSVDSYKKDIISHFICRLMFCLSQEKKDSFINYETLIFKARLTQKTNIKEKQMFEKLSEATDNQSIRWGEITEVDPKQFEQYKQEIYASTRFGGQFDTFNPKRLFKVPIQSCEFLVSRRECFVRQGFAYLSGQLLLKVLPRMYSKYLRLVLDELEHEAYDILAKDTDNQFRQFIRNQPSTIFNQVVSPEQLKQKLNLKNIGVFSRRSFPPCMIQMYDVLTTKKHLKHQARLQLTLFLKVAGMSQQDNQQLWKTNYTKGVNQSQQKEVLYNVRHSYGLQGKRTDYNSKDCDKIINSKPTSGEYHGCPFKYYGNQELTKFLTAKYPSIDQATIATVHQKKEKNQFQLACRSVFEKTHPDPKGKHLDLVKGVGRQPNMYFYQSEKYYQQLKE